MKLAIAILGCSYCTAGVATVGVEDGKYSFSHYFDANYFFIQIARAVRGSRG